MSTYYSDSYTTIDDFNGLYGDSFDSSQSTDPTELSEFDSAASRGYQTYQSSQEGLFQNVGYGAGPLATNPASQNIDAQIGSTRASIYAPQTTYITQAEQGSINEPPWVPFIPQFGPMPGFRRSTAAGSVRLNNGNYAAQGFQGPPINSSVGQGHAWPPQHQSYSNPYPQVPGPPLSQQQPQYQDPSERPKVPIERSATSPSSNSTTSTDRHWCDVPNCNTSTKRLRDMRRHVRTCHGNCADGPFWLCDICGHWEYDARRDKMVSHCKKRPNNHGLVNGRFPFRQVQSVGQQNHVPKIPTGDKLVRRHKKPSS